MPFVAVGHTNLKQLLFVTLPFVFVCFLAIASQQPGTRQIFNDSSHSLRIGLQGPLHVAFFAVLGVIGISFATANLLASNVFTSNGCVDPFINTTLTVVEADTVFQLWWVALNGVSIALSGMIYQAVVRGDCRKQAQATQRCLSALAIQVGKGAQKDALAVWRSQIPVPMWRNLLSFGLHIPFICLAVSPAVGFVSDQLAYVEQAQLRMVG